jgi:hypothetical protein
VPAQTIVGTTCVRTHGSLALMLGAADRTGSALRPARS